VVAGMEKEYEHEEWPLDLFLGYQGVQELHRLVIGKKKLTLGREHGTVGYGCYGKGGRVIKGQRALV